MRWVGLGVFLLLAVLVFFFAPRKRTPAPPALPAPYDRLERALEARDLAALKELAKGEGYAAALAAWRLSGERALALDARRAYLARWRALTHDEHPAALARRLAELGELDEAVRVWRRLLPREAARAALVRLAGQSRAAREALLAVAPEVVLKTARDPLLKARAALRLSEAEKALSLLDGREGAALFLRAEALKKLGRYREALALFRRLGDAYNEGELLLLLGAPERATRAFLRAGDRGAFRAAGLLEKRDPGRAIRLYLQVAGEKSPYADDAALRAWVLARRRGKEDLAKMAWARLDGGLGLLAGKPLFPLTLPPLPRAPEGLDLIKGLLRHGREAWARGEARVRFFASQGEEKRAWGWVLFFLGDPHTAARAGGRLSWGTPYREAVLAASRRFGLEPALLFAVMRVESAFDANALSPTGAKGLFQFTDATWREVARRLGEAGADPFDPETSALFAAAYLRQLRDAFGGDLRLAVVAYNGGPGYVRRVLKAYPDFWDFLRFQPRDEPREYLAKVWQAYAVYRALGEAAFRRPAFLEDLARPR